MTRSDLFRRCFRPLAGYALAGALAVAPVVASQAASPEGGPSAYHNLRYQDDFSYLADPGKSTDYWDGAKYIRLGDDPFGLGTAYLSFGGELRERFENYAHPNFGIRASAKAPLPPGHNGYMLQRAQFNTDLHVNDYLRGFLQLGSMQRIGPRGVSSTTDIDQLDITQGFVDLRLPSPLGDAPVLRVGREEVLLGFQRLVAVREGANSRRDFDGFRLSDTWNGVSLDLLALRPVQNKNDIFDDSPNMKQSLWGSYLTVPVWGGLKADLYWLGYDNAGATFRSHTGTEQRQSFGTRLFGKAAGWDWNEEAVVQIGRFNGHDIRAWMLGSIIGYTFETAPWQPRLALEANAASGDNPRSGTIGTFNAMFPRLPYFAELSLLVPANVCDVRPVVSFKPASNVTVVAGWDTLWRASTRDSLYGNGEIAFTGTSKVSGAGIGSEGSLDVRWQPDQHLTLGTIYAHFIAGPALTEAHGKDVNFAVVFATYKF